MEGGFRKELTTAQLTMLGLGSIVGSGVFVLTGLGIGAAGPAASLAYIFAAVAVVITSLPSLICGTTLPATGGYYQYISRLVDPTLGFFYMWNRIIGIFGTSVVAIAFGDYFTILIPGVPKQVLNAAIIIFFVLINLKHIGFVGQLNSILVYVMLFSLALFLILGAPQIDLTRMSGYFQKGGKGLLLAIVFFMYALDGAPVIINLGNESKDPRKSIPIAMVVAILSAGLLYAAIAFIATAAADWKDLAGQSLAAYAQKFMSRPVFVFFIVGGAMIAILTTLNGSIMVQSRIFWAACRDGIFPTRLAKLNRSGVPGTVTILVGIVVVIPVITNMSLEFVALLTTLANLLFNLMLPFAMVRVPKKFPLLYRQSYFRPGKVGLWLILLICWVVNVRLSWSSMLQLGGKAILAMAIFYLVGAGYYFLMDRQHRRRTGEGFRECAGQLDTHWVEAEAALQAQNVSVGGLG